MFDVFISYSHQDKLVADAACARLEAQGMRCWIAPRNLIPGQSYGEGITIALRSCRALVLIFSDNANRSRHVSIEVERAVNNNVPIVPFRIENVRPSDALEYFVGPIHWLDAFPKPLDHLKRLADNIQTLLTKQPPDSHTVAPISLPLAKPTRWKLYAVVSALTLLAMTIGWFVIRSWQSTSKIVVNSVPNPPYTKQTQDSTQPIPSRPAQKRTTAATNATPSPSRSNQPVSVKPAQETSTEVSNPTAEKKTQDGTVSGVGPLSLAGCWLYNNKNVRMDSAGEVTGFVPGAHWSSAGANRYVITWPNFVDTFKLSIDGESLTGSDNFGPPISARRVSGSPLGFPGVWQWTMGITVTVTADPGGSVLNGSLTGRWATVGYRTYKIEWSNFPMDQLVMSEDGQSFYGSNQFGIVLAGRRVACVN